MKAARLAGTTVTAEQRVLFAAAAERSLLEHRLAVGLTAQGPANSELDIRADFASRVVAYDLVKSGFVTTARELGFRRVTLADGLGHNWLWQLD